MQDFFSLSLSFLFSSYDKFYSFSSLILHIRFSDDDLFFMHGVWMSQKKSQTTFNVYILNGLKMPKIGNLASFWKPGVCCQTVLPVNFIRTNTSGNAKIEKFRWDYFELFSNNVRFFNQEIIGEKIWQEWDQRGKTP